MSRIPQHGAITYSPPQKREPEETTPDLDDWLAPPSALSREMIHEHRIAQLESRVMLLERELPMRIAAMMGERLPACTMLSSLGIPGFSILKSIPVTIRPDGNEFIATFFDANVSSGGDTQQEAVANLQSLIADFYDELAAVPEEQLGPSLKRQKHVLAEFVCRT